ncbi:MAG: hypothetical protein E7162_06750 [Firmicutes bacterium]|nr:hypothetical protein [Bacillota bacterium]
MITDATDKELYFIKLPVSFWSKDMVMHFFEEENGFEYIILYEQLLFLTINKKGYLAEEYESKLKPLSLKRLSRSTWHEESFIKKALEKYEKYGVIVKKDNECYFMRDALKMTKSMTRQAFKKEVNRNSKNFNKEDIRDESLDDCPDDCPDDSLDDCPIDIEKDKKEEKEIRNKKKEKKNKEDNIELDKDNCDLVVADAEILTDKDIIAEKVINYLNKRTGSTFKCEKEYKELIFKWLDKGYKYEDFIRAIDNKCSDWLNTKYQSGLNPKKLFGDDFKLYTSQAPKKRTLTDISFAEIEEAIRIRKENEINGFEDNNEEIRVY